MKDNEVILESRKGLKFQNFKLLKEELNSFILSTLKNKEFEDLKLIYRPHPWRQASQLINFKGLNKIA
jgi:hypothetical protein